MNILLDGKQKAKMGGIVVLMIIGALLEACSIGLVIPVITTLLDPAAVTGMGIWEISTVSSAWRAPGSLP